MRISELKSMIKVAEDLGYGDAEIMIDQSRDGKEYFSKARAKFKRSSAQLDGAILVVSHA